ncbi:MAG: Rrf2 family transcriptional regulator [Telmatospirillum sp.]|nr:Rrf2 family transcriptional regulator [Telmatospirillum sp.]
MSKNCRFAVAVHVATLLAQNSGASATSDWIAGSVNTNPVVVRRILSALAKAGLVTSQRGIAGGSVLARPPAAITLLDLYRAVDEQGPQSLHHQPPNPACPVGARIVPVLEDILSRAEQAKERELGRITVADVLAAVHTPQCGARTVA